MRYDVSIIIVSYNTIEITKQCINSIYAMTSNINYEVIVSDNGSTDGSIEMIKLTFPAVILIENKENIGFGKANNRALKKARGKYIFYLNSDTLLLNNAVKYFFDFWENYPSNLKLGAIGANLLNEKKVIVHSGGTFPTYISLCKWQTSNICIHFLKTILSYRSFYVLSNLGLRLKSKLLKPIYGDIDYITGADLFMKNNNNALFDERFFLYYEETDLELQLKKLDLKRLLIDGPKIIHLTKKRENKYPISGIASIYNQLSAITYAQKNLNTRAKFLSLLIKIDWLNPYIHKHVKIFWRNI